MEYHEALKEFQYQYSQIWALSDLSEIRFAWDQWKEDAFKDERITSRQKIVWACPVR